MYATLREYEGIKDPAEATQPLLDGLLAPGFRKDVTPLISTSGGLRT
jgi:hypothetical protein